MFRQFTVLVLLLTAFCLPAFGQVDTKPGRDALHPRPVPETPVFKRERLFPMHVVQNPRGFSPICRFELKVEDRLPVGLWLKLEDDRLSEGMLKDNAHVRLKLLRF